MFRLPITMRTLPEIFKWHRCALRLRSFAAQNFSLRFEYVFRAQSYNKEPFLSLFEWLHNAKRLLAIRAQWDHAYFPLPLCRIPSMWYRWIQQTLSHYQFFHSHTLTLTGKHHRFTTCTIPLFKPCTLSLQCCALLMFW